MDTYVHTYSSKRMKLNCPKTVVKQDSRCSSPKAPKILKGGKKCFPADRNSNCRQDISVIRIQRDTNIEEI